MNKEYKSVSSNQKRIYEHRLIMELFLNRPLLKSEYIDHINGNKLDNRIKNLRICNQSQNGANRKQLNKNNKSGYRGVYFMKRDKLWVAQIKLNYKMIYLGRFKTSQQAAKIYDLKAKELFGEYALLNFKTPRTF